MTLLIGVSAGVGGVALLLCVALTVAMIRVWKSAGK